MKRIAVIDLGSNSARMTVADVCCGSYKIIYNKSRYIRLSEGISCDSNTLKIEPVIRSLLAIKQFSDKADELSADSVCLFATEAVRRADNREWYIAFLKEHTGLELQILDGRDEAYFDCVAASSETGFYDYFMIDTGGGSTEIALVQEGKMVRFQSFPWGAVTLTELFSGGTTLSVEEYNNAAAFVAEGIASAEWILNANESLPLVALGGSARTYKKLANGYNIYDFIEKVLKMSVPERVKFGISSDRADILTAGLLPLAVLSAAVNPRELIVCQSSLRNGFLIVKSKGTD